MSTPRTAPEFHKTSSQAHARLRPRETSSYHSARASQEVEAPPAYLLERTDQTCHRRFLGTNEEVQAEISDHGRDGVQRVLVVHGLPVELTKSIQESLDIEPGFIEAHGGRRRYRSLKRRVDAEFVHFEYPELLVRNAGDDLPDMLGSAGQVKDLGVLDGMDGPALHTMSPSGGVVSFCHVSLWMAGRMGVLFLDRPAWRDHSSHLRKARRPPTILTPYHPGHGTAAGATLVLDAQLSEEDESPSLEETLLETLKDFPVGGDNVVDVLTRTAYEHWLDFFDALPPVSLSEEKQDIALLCQVMRSLEQNHDMARDLERKGQGCPDITVADWDKLLSRAQRRINPSALLTSEARLNNTTASSLTTSMKGTDDLRASLPPAEEASLDPIERESQEANKRSLDRVAYLGGLMLPFTVVSGVLSMEGDYGPDGPKFWIFWLAAIISAAICLVIIYLDKLRFGDVWVEVARGDAIEAIFQPASGAAMGRARQGFQVISETEGGQPMIWFQGAVNGERTKAWKRKHLGWGGAVKKMVGYYRFRGGQVMFQRPGVENRTRVNTI